MDAPPSLEEPLNPNRWIILVGLILAAVMEVLDTTIVNVSLPQMAGNLGATTEEIGWVATGYILSNVVVLPLTAWLSFRFGRKRYLGASILLFVLSSFFCGTSTSLASLVAWRILQGAGGAALLSTAQATIREIFPRDQQGLVQSIYVLGIIVAPTLGPTVGGWITDNYSWHWNFLINVPIGLLAFFLVYTFLEDSSFQMKVQRLDVAGILLLTSGLGCLQYALESGNDKGWFESAAIVWPFAIAAATLPVFAWWQLSPRNAHPVVNLRVLRNRELSAALVLFVVLGFGLYGGVFIFPLFAQSIMGLSPTETGLSMLPGGIATGCAAITVGRLLNGPRPRFDPRLSIVLGLALFVTSMFDLGALPAYAGSGDVQLALIVRGLGLGMLFVPINLAAFATLRGAEIAQGAAMLNLSRQIGGTFGIAALGSFITRQAASARLDLMSDLYRGNPALEQRLNAAAQGLMAHGYSPTAAHQAALALADRGVTIQAHTIAFNSGFMLIGIVSIISSVAVLALKKPQPQPVRA